MTLHNIIVLLRKSLPAAQRHYSNNYQVVLCDSEAKSARDEVLKRRVHVRKQYKIRRVLNCCENRVKQKVNSRA